MEALETWRGVIAAGQDKSYALGFAAVDYMACRWGDSAVIETYWSVQAEGRPWQEAFQKTFRASISAFYSDFATYRGTMLTAASCPAAR